MTPLPFAALLLALPAPPGPETPPAAPVSPVAAPGWKAEDHYRYAVRCLVNGRTYERAAEHLREACRLAPENADYRLALACACTARHVSLSMAFFAQTNVDEARRRYPEARAAYEAAAKKSKERGERIVAVEPEPPPPADFTVPCRDDGKPPPASREVLADRLAALRREALSSFDRARELARTAAAPTRAEVERARGWATFLLNFVGAATERAVRQPAGKEREADYDESTALRGVRVALRSLERGTELAPEDADSWELLGCLREILSANGGIPAPDPKPSGVADGGDDREPEQPTSESTWAAYDRALALNKRNAPLWFKRAWYERNKAGQDEAKGRAAALPYLQAAAKADPANALYRFEIAALQFDATPFLLTDMAATNARLRDKGTPPYSTPEFEERLRRALEEGKKDASRAAGREALRSLEWGNTAPAAALVRHRAPVPKLLAAAWAEVGVFMERNTAPTTSEATLAAAVSGYANAVAESGDRTEAERAARDLIAAGEKLMGDWPVRDRGRMTGEVDLARSGRFLVTSGYRLLVEVRRRMGDADGAAQAETQKATVDARLGEWRAAVDAARRADRRRDPLLPAD
jgi:tetratricopeptide (TPR) repeat protein